MSVRGAIFAQFQEVAHRQDRCLSVLRDDTALNDTGLDSLCFAIIVARLEDDLGIDPFSMPEDFPFPGTVGEFVSLYEHALECTTPS
ncbi:MAG TPA: acyl carrier protein [Rhizomicrobium sp.]|nr:acyl carrier protein [Rhizomicrobium sp.]